MKSKNPHKKTVKIKFVTPILAAFCAISVLLCGHLGEAQTLQLQYTFADGPGTTTTSSGALPVVMTLLSNGLPADIHGPANSGVQNRGFSLNLSHNPISGNSGVQAFAVASNNTTLATLGTVGDFTASVWFKISGLTTNLINNSTRFFNLAPNGVNDNGNANSIGLNISVGNGSATFPKNAINVLVGSAAATIPPIYYDFPTNEWLYCAFTYTSASGVVAVYFGTEASPAKLYVTRSIPAGTTFNLVGTGGGTSLSLGNRISGARDFPGWIGDFRFYTGAGDSNFVENLRQSDTAVVISNLNPDGSLLLQGTNTLTFTASSTNGISTNNIKVLVNGTDVSSNLSFSGTSTSLNVVYPNLPVNSTLLQQTNLNGVGVQIVVADNAGITTSNAYVYDDFSPTNFTWECEDYDFGGGLFIDNPAMSFTIDTNNSYYGEQTPYIDQEDATDNGAGAPRIYRDIAGAVETEYSAGSGNNGGNSIGELTRQVVWNTYATNTIAGEVNVGFFDGPGVGAGVPNWMNYTRTYPSGNYNVYLRVAEGGGSGSSSFDLVTGGWGTTNQTLSHLGSCTWVNSGGWDSFSWAPLRDSSGNLVKVTLGGTTNTFRLTAGTGGGGNVNFFLFTPANTNLPTISNIYPNGTNMFQPSPTLSFAAASPAGVNISTNSIKVTLTATSLLGKASTNIVTATNGLSFTGSATNRTVTASLQSNFLYTATITVIDANGSTASSTVSFDTLAPAYTWEAPDYDYNSGLFLPDPVPVDGYSNLAGSSTIDYLYANTLTQGNTYRDNLAVGVENNGDSPLRLQYITNSPAPQAYDIGFFNGGDFLNYTRNFPAGEYNIFARAADGSTTGALGDVAASVVTNGWGTASQGTTNLGSFNFAPTGGWQTYVWVPMRDANGNLVKFTGGTTNTLKMTSSGSQNVFFYALFPANTNLPTLVNLYPNGTTLSQATNTFSFNVVSTAGVSSNSVVVTVNGNVVSNLVFTGTPNNWSVTYPHLQPSSAYVITVFITDANGNTSSATVTFDTMSPNNYTWEAEDFDHDGGLFIDNPQTNAYATSNAVAGVDSVQVNFGGSELYRPNGMDTEINGDVKRAQYLDLSNPQSDYSIGFFSDGAWANYTRNYPAGTYNVFGRFAAGGGPTDATLSEVVTNWGTTSQVTNMLGTFSIPNTGGWENYSYVPLRDPNGNLVALTLNGSTNTLQLGRPSDNPGSPDVNVNFLMLTPVFTTSATHSGTNIVVSFQTISGFNYQVQHKTNLTDPIWIPLGSPLPGNNALRSITDPTTSVSRFYRVQIQ